MIKKLALVSVFVLLAHELNQDGECDVDDLQDPEVFSTREDADQWIAEYGDTDNYHYEVLEARIDSLLLEDEDEEEVEEATDEDEELEDA